MSTTVLEVTLADAVSVIEGLMARHRHTFHNRRDHMPVEEQSRYYDDDYERGKQFLKLATALGNYNTPLVTLNVGLKVDEDLQALEASGAIPADATVKEVLDALSPAPNLPQPLATKVQEELAAVRKRALQDDFNPDDDEDEGDEPSVADETEAGEEHGDHPHGKDGKFVKAGPEPAKPAGRKAKKS